MLRERAITKLDALDAHLDAVVRLLLAQHYAIHAWVPSACLEICMRDAPLCEQEVRTLGAKTSAQLAAVRERVLGDMILQMQQQPHRKDKCGKWPLPKPARDPSRVAQFIEEVFRADGQPDPSTE